MGSFCKSHIKFQLSLMTLKSDAKLKEKLTCDFKYDIVNFHPTTQKSENFTSMGYFCPKYLRFELIKYRGVIFLDSEQWCKIWKILTLWFQKCHEELGELSLEHSKSEKLYIDGFFLPKAYNVSAIKFHRNYVSWHWRVMQNLKGNWLVAWKMT